MSKPVHITIAEVSDVIRRGISSLLGEIGSFSFVLSEISEPEQMKNTLALQRPDILIISPAFQGLLSLPQIKKEVANPDMKCVVLQASLADAANTHYYDGAISLYDSADSIKDKLAKLIEAPSVKRHEPLSQREKDIITCVIKGMTNKQIADKLYLSVHTIHTHRRNISAKLNIRSTTGLTIYAISNQLVKLDELQRKDWA